MAALSPAQLQTLKTAIAADPAINTLPNNPDGNSAIADYLNTTATPTFTVWKSKVTRAEVGQTFNASELGGLTTGNTQRLQNLAAWLDTINPSLATVRAFFDDVFSGAGGTNTRAALAALWKRAATRAEKLLATGTGSDAVPATLGFEGRLTYQDVENARNS